MTVYTDNTPVGANPPRLDRPNLTANTHYLALNVGTDHNFTQNTANANDGYHKVIHFVTQGGNPGVVATAGQLYTKTQNAANELFYMNNAGTVTQLTGAGSAAANGYTTLPGGILLQWGQFLATGPNPTAFPRVFTTVYQVVTTNNSIDRVLGVTAVGNASFSWTISNPTGAIVCRYIAVGLA